MSIDDLISIFLFLLFIVVPLLNRAGKKPGRSGSGRSGPGRSGSGRGRTGQGRTGRGAQTQSAEPSPSGSAQRTEDDFRRRVEEARRRVQEAVESQTQTESSSAQGLETASDMFSGGTAATSDMFSADRFSAPQPQSASLAAGSSAYDNLVLREKKTISKPLQVQRGGAKGATLSGEVLAFGRSDLMRGIIWKQILDEPRSKRSWRQQSQHL